MDHLSRLKVDVSEEAAFAIGTEAQQCILARLRFGSNNLNASRSRRCPNINEECECGSKETVEHFLFDCPSYECLRSVMVSSIRTVWKGRLCEELLLRGSSRSLSSEQLEVIVSAVATYVEDTKRRI